MDKKDAVLPWLVGELNKLGVKNESITLLIALGTHAAPGRDVMHSALGQVASRIETVFHDSGGPFTDYGLTSSGTRVLVNTLVSEADLVITYSAVVHHYFAGYGGGRKIIVPGVASPETIRQNHSLLWENEESDSGRNPNAASGETERNPIFTDMVEAVKIVLKDKPHFSISTVLSPEKDHYGFFAGDIFETHKLARDLADEVFMVELEGRADITIASSGGYPKDLNMIQAHKGLDNAVRATIPGGTIIMLMGCSEGLGNEIAERYCPYSIREAKDNLIEKYEISGAAMHSIKCKSRDHRIIVVSELDQTAQKQLGFERAKDLQSAVNLIQPDDWRSARIYCMPRADLVVPKVKSMDREISITHVY